MRNDDKEKVEEYLTHMQRVADGTEDFANFTRAWEEFNEYRGKVRSDLPKVPAGGSDGLPSDGNSPNIDSGSPNSGGSK